MDTTPDDTLRLLRDSVLRFVEKEVMPHGAAWEERGFVPREVLLGVRPQDLAVHAVEQAGAVPARVTLLQLVGSEMLVDLAFGEAGRLTAEVKADAPLVAGQKVWLRLDRAGLHLFDTATGRNLAAER